MNKIISGVIFLTILTSACVSMHASLAKRATFDLGCSVKESDITEIISGQYGVIACGCKATYVSYPTWTLNAVSGEKCTAQDPKSTVP